MRIKITSYKIVTKRLQKGYNYITVMLQDCYNHITIVYEMRIL